MAGGTEGMEPGKLGKERISWASVDPLLTQLKNSVVRAVKHYNALRQHLNPGKKSPAEFTQQWQRMIPELRPKFTIFDTESSVKPVNLF